MDKNYLIEELKLIEKAKTLQMKFDFKIPKYVLSEIVLPNYSKNNLCALINLAVMNNKLSKHSANILKKNFCKNKKS
ncbi:MAG: hypothetical protein Q4G09_02715 [Clostridia bacterium]|nr:hypothetical protein [Clostridia bacterium]